MKIKKCSKCDKGKPLSEFYKNSKSPDGLSYWCKNCKKEWQRENPEYMKKYRKENKDSLAKYHKEWEEENSEYRKKYRKEYNKKYYQENKEFYKEHTKEYHRNRKKEDESFHLNSTMATAISLALKGNKAGRHWEDLVGYTLEKLMQRLSVNFKKGMSFDNYGDWHIDHRKPKNLFDYEKPEDQAFKDCWALVNLQPLWAEENLEKSDNFNKPII